MNKTIILQEHINEAEKTQALKLFKQLLIEKSEILKDTRYKPAETIEQSCFISGGFKNDNGEYDGIFFPNSEFEGKNFICLAFQNGKPCMVCHHELKLQNETKTWDTAEKLENLIYEREELEEINNLKNTINYYNMTILTLERYQRKRTKSGGNFKELFRNFESSHEMKLSTNVYGEFKSVLNISNYNTYINIGLISDIKDVTPEEIEKAIQHEIEEYKKRIKETLNKIEILHAETLEAVKIFNNVFNKSKNFKTRILRNIFENRLYKFQIGE